MSDFIQIRILEKESNRLGDLFGRLMADLFIALGYEQPRLNIHKSGREIDLSANHRLEPRRAIGECKAHEELTGGADLNKFVGVLDVEYDDKIPLIGYFISLSGFKETAIEQEMQRKRTKLITLTGSQVVEELIKGRILIPKEKATELAGRCCSDKANLIIDPEVELLAHQLGWIWAIYYTVGKERTHFALIHSDGTPLASALVNEVVFADRNCEGTIENLTCLNPKPIPSSDTDPQITHALSAYAYYLENECGYIHLDGLPADSDVGSRRLSLENLFVPLNLDVTIKKGEEFRKLERQPVGAIISKYPRLGLLAAPGGGKSTLLKRLAVAYIDTNRRQQIDDNLPPRNWLPLFFRCRELRGLARGSFAELLEALAKREPVRQYQTVFRAFIDRALLEGRVLLLVDGLDEISDPGDRAAFVCTIRTALQAYPEVAAVVTSREAGFRHVAAHLAPVCTHAVVSPFNPDDIRRLSIAWHREVVGDTEKVRSDAEQLANTIVRNDRIKLLAVNPLLLTTLLLVKRWVGSLPTRRAVLYGKAVEVLLMTWNTEGHEPIPEEEAMPQLCFVASGMMLAGLQKVSRPRLASLLQDARDSLPTELGYVKNSVEQFIHRIEDRSSLLMMTGHDVEDGQLVEFFEFRHLTFQEFLTARSIVQGWHPGRNEKDTLVSALEPHFEQEQWREVIPLAAVMGGKGTEALIQRLTVFIGNNKSISKDSHTQSLSVLVNCLADEAAARPETIRAALSELVWKGTQLLKFKSANLLCKGKYGADFREEVGIALTSGASNIINPGNALIVYVKSQLPELFSGQAYTELAQKFFNLLESSIELIRCEGIVGLGILFDIALNNMKRSELEQIADSFCRTESRLLTLLNCGTNAECSFAAFALGHLGHCRIWKPAKPSELLGKLFVLWMEGGCETVKVEAHQAFLKQAVVTRDEGSWSEVFPRAHVDLLLQNLNSESSEKSASWELKDEILAGTLLVAYYLHAMTDKELIHHCRTLPDTLGKTDRPDEFYPVYREAIRELVVQLNENPDINPNLDLGVIRKDFYVENIFKDPSTTSPPSVP
jgi:hypothetical protein